MKTYTSLKSSTMLSAIIIFTGIATLANGQGIQGGAVGGQPQNPGGQVRQFGGGGGGFNMFGMGGGFNMFGMGASTPEMAKKTARIAALRSIVALKLTVGEIGAALPPLRELRNAEKAMQTDSERLLDDEENALLAMKPDDPMPASSGKKLQSIAQTYREKSLRTWTALTISIGQEKSNGLRQLVEGSMAMPGGGGYGMPGGGFPGGQGGPNSPGGPGNLPGNPNGPMNPPNGGGGQPGNQGDPNGPGPGGPGPDQSANAGPSASLDIQPAQQPEMQVVRPGQGGQGGGFQGGQGGGFQGGQGGVGGPGGGFGGGGMGAGQRGGGGMGMMVGMFQPRVSVADLVDLLEKKFAAMK